MSGTDLLLTNMLKSFMPKESAEKIAGWATNGTFDRIGALPADIAEIKASQARIELELGKLFALVQAQSGYQQPLLAGGNAYPIPGSAGDGPFPFASPEHRTDGGPGSNSSASGVADNGRVGNSEAAE